MTAARYASLPAMVTAPPADALAFEEVFRGFRDEVYGVALRLTGDRDVADDVTSAVFLKAYRAFERYDPSRPLRAWLLTIAVREAISAGRAASRDVARRRPAEDGLAVAAPEGEGPETLAVASEERGRVRDAVAALPAIYRVPVVLRYFSDLRLEEIAAVTGQRTATIAVRLHRARRLLRVALEGGTA